MLDGPVADAPFETEVLIEHNTVLLLPAAHPLADMPNMDITQLRDEQFVL